MALIDFSIHFQFIYFCTFHVIIETFKMIYLRCVTHVEFFSFVLIKNYFCSLLIELLKITFSGFKFCNGLDIFFATIYTVPNFFQVKRQFHLKSFQFHPSLFVYFFFTRKCNTSNSRLDHIFPPEYGT